MTRSLPSFFFDPGMCSTRDDDDDRVYLTPNGENEKKALEAKFQRVSHGLVREGVQDTASREIGKSHVFFFANGHFGKLFELYPPSLGPEHTGKTKESPKSWLDC